MDNSIISINIIPTSNYAISCAIIAVKNGCINKIKNYFNS